MNQCIHDPNLFTIVEENVGIGYFETPWNRTNQDENFDCYIIEKVALNRRPFIFI